MYKSIFSPASWSRPWSWSCSRRPFCCMNSPPLKRVAKILLILTILALIILFLVYYGPYYLHRRGCRFDRMPMRHDRGLEKRRRLQSQTSEADRKLLRDVEWGRNYTMHIDKCKCSKGIYTVGLLAKENSSSRCTSQTWKYGRGQKIISYSLYDGNPNDSRRTLTRYLEYLKRNILTIPELYPGWILRIYSDVDLKTHPEFCPLVCDNSYVEWCDVHELPVVGDISPSFGMTWRFVTIGDPLVDVFLSRDIDSPILPRERHVVDEWLETSKAIHVMRDHAAHVEPVLGGLWGVRLDILPRSLGLELQNQFIEGGNSKKWYGSDQQLLSRIFYSEKYFDEIIAHDRNYCSSLYLTECCDFPKPWGVQRAHEFVGCYYLPEGKTAVGPQSRGFGYCTDS